MKNSDRKKICDTCGGNGQISFFQGVSRFLLSTEDCPNCAGLGYLLPENGESALLDKTRGKRSTKKKKKSP